MTQRFQDTVPEILVFAAIPIGLHMLSEASAKKSFIPEQLGERGPLLHPPPRCGGGKHALSNVEGSWGYELPTDSLLGALKLKAGLQVFRLPNPDEPIGQAV